MNEIYDFGIILRELRKSRNLTQKRLAEKLEVTEATVSKYEGGTAFPPFDKIRALSNILNVSVDTLYGTEPRNTISSFGLNDNQTALLVELADALRAKNAGNKKRFEEYCTIIGKLTTELQK